MKTIQAFVRGRVLPVLAAGWSLSACALPADGGADASEGSVDATEEELRRWDFGMSRSLSVQDVSGTWQTVSLPGWTIQTTDSTVHGPLRDRGVTAFTSLSWVGDANSYVDVFDNPLETTVSIFGTSFSSPGSTRGSFMRFRYPHASDAQFTFFLPPRMTPIHVPRSFNATLPADARWRGLRHYDRGECADEASWSEVLASIMGGLTPRLDQALRAESLGGATLSGSATGSPSFQVGRWGDGVNHDTFTVSASYDVGACNGLLRLSFTGRFGVSLGLPTFTVTSVSAPLDFRDDACAGFLALVAGHGFNAGGLQDEIRASLEASLRAELGPAIQLGMRRAAAQRPLPSRLRCTRGDAGCADVIRLGLPPAAAAALRPENATCLELDGAAECVFVPSFRRINTRPDGLEIVLSDTRSDPFYGVYRDADAALCSRPEGSTAAPMRSSYAPVSFP